MKLEKLPFAIAAYVGATVSFFLLPMFGVIRFHEFFRADWLERTGFLVGVLAVALMSGLAALIPMSTIVSHVKTLSNWGKLKAAVGLPLCLGVLLYLDDKAPEDDLMRIAMLVAAAVTGLVTRSLHDAYKMSLVKKYRVEARARREIRKRDSRVNNRIPTSSYS